jgi:hypothetical protein
MSFPVMTTTQQFPIANPFLDRKGKPAPVDGVPTWASSNEAVATVVPDPGGLSATVVAQGVGKYTISVSGDADLGPGITTLTGQDSGEVTQGTATQVTLAPGAVVEQPNGPPPPPPPPPVA